MNYLTIDSVGDHAELRGDTPATAFRSVLESSLGRTTTGIMGWFYLAPMGETMPRGFGEDVAAAAANVLQPWQTTLVMTAGTRGADGAFLLWDSIESHAFRAPFYELLDGRAMKPNAPKLTQVVWPSYATSDLVAPAPLGDGNLSEVARADTPPAPAQPPSRWAFWRGRGAPAPLHTNDRKDESAPARSQPPPPTGRPAQHQAATDTTREQGPPASQPESDIDYVDYADTTEGNRIERYIAIARKDGFWVAAKFNAEASPGERETLWVLQDPYAGLLLTVTANDTRVLEASLHYNVHVNDPEALQSTFSEHRNDEAQVIYVRESAIDQLRARSERARATGQLQREWKVTPTIYFVTPNEWDAVASGDAPGPAIDALNRHRIAAIADSITSRFGLRTPAENQ